jgi:hypothetical protein
VTGAELASVAALKGVPVHAIVREQWADRARGLETPATAAWNRMPWDVRCLLVTTATTRENIENAAAMSWAGFTDDEQVKMGAAARAIARGLGEAEWLR